MTPPSDQERVRDYHAAQCLTWIKFAVQAWALRGWPDAAHLDREAAYHARLAAHYARLAELIPAVKELTAQAQAERERRARKD